MTLDALVVVGLELPPESDRRPCDAEHPIHLT
eukprot:CAMPEP_0174333002 /NCGR_PEP_ID=MMETSP0810-20121108/18763_1 /TAXON_ID=73025 ORGANISM="Eutreptiella gymnastica-like, Strain CCMP1594" /NCGR_SAMPLE_ID=MMETSP0810 /ASSEMBLY_ACC=CAM_ASM_000659 /LENGTH=31 /DNA_ID= /DNA_START= /DNA_END= /DNA_ORIENTATION=